jgi:hypothetical protein
MDDLTRACLKANARYRALRHYGAEIAGEWRKQLIRKPYQKERSLEWAITMLCSAGCTRTVRLPFYAEKVEDVGSLEKSLARWCTCGELRKLLQEDTPEIKALIEMELLAAG